MLVQPSGKEHQTIRENNAARCIIGEAKKENCNSAKVKGLWSVPSSLVSFVSTILFCEDLGDSIPLFCLGLFESSVKLCQSHVLPCDYGSCWWTQRNLIR